VIDSVSRLQDIEGVSFQPRDLPIGPVVFQLGQGKLIDGLDLALQGTMPGAKLRILVPPSAGYLNEQLEPKLPGFAAQRQVINHKQEPFLFEVQVRKVIKG
jgi:FKBP-type peptidyl-prolyl cis-trans isomerase 2